ncbi:MAG: tRNA (adenosine(37)-N6)-dimethylallyltransferase MiaA [Muribaculaceae bacterium]|nr:tRNA (adenosine(37)-N6)-dimethylallyltransferase MiaA [Muribaculaceae bacterium]
MPAFTPDTLPAIVIVGPTACGKTRRGVDVARRFGGEIVSADSRQVYVGMDVGTGKDLADYGNVPYHLIDVVPAGSKYNLYKYLRDARSAVDDIRARHRLPVIVGGTGMYVENLLKGTVLPEVPENPELRRSLEGLSLDELAGILEQTKTLHNTTDIDTVQRAVRAIEIERYYIDNPEAAEAARSPRTPLDALIICVDIPREERRRLISERMRRRFDSENMLDEVRRLIDGGVDPESLIYYGLEYKYLTLHILGRLTRAEMEEQLETAIHQFAKRQMTWFRGMERRGFTLHNIPWNLGEADFIAEVERLLINA